MKNFLYVFVIVFSFFVSCRNSDEFVIKGKLTNYEGLKKVNLYLANELIDSAFVDADGGFTFKRVGPEPDFYGIEAGEKSYQLIARNGDEIEFEADLKSQSNVYTIDGSEASSKIIEFNGIAQKYQDKFKELEARYNSLVAGKLGASSDTEAVKKQVIEQMTPEFQEVVDGFGNEALDFGKKNKDNLAGFYAISSIDQGSQTNYEPELIAYAETIGPIFPKNKAVQDFAKKMNELKPVSIGKMAPHFELPDVNGKMVKLSDFKGNYVLVDFWASWCGPCRQENPNVVKAFRQFSGRGFAVLGVSLDEHKEDWKKAIAADGLAWTQVSDLKQWNSEAAALYKVSAIPASFLLDPEGKIVAKNLRGERLTDFLKKHLK